MHRRSAFVIVVLLIALTGCLGRVDFPPAPTAAMMALESPAVPPVVSSAADRPQPQADKAPETKTPETKPPETKTPETKAPEAPAQAGQTQPKSADQGQQPPKPTATQPQALAVPPPQPAKSQPRLAILVYHEVDDFYQSAFSVTPAHLEAQIRMLKDEGYTFYDLAMVERLLAGGQGLPEKGVMLAFDDGYQSFVTQVLPLAERHQVPAVCFVVTKYMSFDIIFGRPHMAPVEMKAAVDSPWLDLAGHSFDGHRQGITADGSMQPLLTHRIQHHLAPAVETDAEYRDRVLNDFVKTAGVLREYGVTTGLRHYTFPYTARSDEAVALGQQAGFRYFYIGGEELVTPDSDPTAIPRVHAGAPYITADVLRETLRTLFSRP